MSSSLSNLLQARLSVENLEARVTPASPIVPGISATSANGTLTINGTALSDNIIVFRDQLNRIEILGLHQTYTVKQVRRIDVHGGAGDDYIDLDSGNRPGERTLDTPATIYGDAGNDTIFGGNGSDMIYGGDGDDSLAGMGGSDYINGGSGTDLFYGGSGRDTYRDDFKFDQWAVDGVSAQDVQQGAGGTCTILSVLAAAAAKNANLAANIQYLGNNTYNVRLNDTYLFGLYQRPINVKVYFDGTWYDSDAQPSMQRDADGSPTGPPTGDFWTTIYQRAVLQYTGTNWRDPAAVENWAWSETAARNTILGVGNSGSVSKSDTKLPAHLAQLIRDGVIMTAGTPDYKDSKGNSIDERDGIVGYHAYAVLDVYQQDGAWRVRLYNPWGWDNEGDVQMDSRDDGTIDISWDVFARNFEDYSWFKRKP